jgi:hypothetical protein
VPRYFGQFRPLGFDDTDGSVKAKRQLKAAAREIWERRGHEFLEARWDSQDQPKGPWALLQFGAPRDATHHEETEEGGMMVERLAYFCRPR